MTLLHRFTIYRIARDHGNETGFFLINVPEVRQRGVGFQLRVGGVVYGVSLHTRPVRNTEPSEREKRAIALGWYSREVKEPGTPYCKWVICEKDHPDATPDLNAVAALEMGRSTVEGHNAHIAWVLWKQKQEREP